MPVFRYFAWMGSCLLAALFAASWCLPAAINPAPRSAIPLHESINIRIHTDHKWPERLELDTTRSPLPLEVDKTADIGPSEPLALTERQPFEAFAEMSVSPVRPCFRPPCPDRQVADRDALPIWRATPPDRWRSLMSARRVLTFPNQPHRPPGKS